jgi:hypothetical protein
LGGGDVKILGAFSVEATAGKVDFSWDKLPFDTFFVFFELMGASGH